MQFFPIVTASNDVRIAVITLHDAPTSGKRYTRIEGPREIQVDTTLLFDRNSRLGVMAAIASSPSSVQGWLTTNLPGVEGCSLGLATSLCLLGAPPIVSTGYTNAFGRHEAPDLLDQIDDLQFKIPALHSHGVPLLCAASAMNQQQPPINEWWRRGLFYTPIDYLQGRSYDMSRNIAATADTLIEALVFAPQLAHYMSADRISALMN